MGKAIQVPAGPQIDGFRPHLTLEYVHNVILFAGVAYATRRFTKENIPLDKNGFRSIRARPLDKDWGPNSIRIKGPLSDFKIALRGHLTSVFGPEILGDPRPAHVNVKGNWEQPLYEYIRLLDRP